MIQQCKSNPINKTSDVLNLCPLYFNKLIRSNSYLCTAMTILLHTSKICIARYQADTDVVVRSISPNHFHCFCYKLYYLSSFKDFYTIAPGH